jgi:hypothetical protein
MIAAGWLAVTRAHEHQVGRAEQGDAFLGSIELIPLTANEIRRLLAHLVLAPIHGLDRRLSWSRWRRRR